MYSSTDVMAATGLTFRTVDRWAREGVLEPSLAAADGSGTARRYSDDDLRVAKALAAVYAAFPSRPGVHGDVYREVAHRARHTTPGAPIRVPIGAGVSIVVEQEPIVEDVA